MVYESPIKKKILELLEKDEAAFRYDVAKDPKIACLAGIEDKEAWI